MKSLLKVTSKARLGLILVSELATRKEGERVSLEEVARKAGASRKFLEQIAGELRRAGIVEGLRGAAGGYRLTHDPAELTVVEVLNAIEGPMDIEECLAHVKGPFFARRAQNDIWATLQGQIMEKLMNTTIADLAR